MPHDHDSIEIVHPGAAEGAVGGREAGRLDDRGVDPETGAGAHHRSCVLGNIRLVEREQDGHVWLAHRTPNPAVSSASR